MRRFAKKTILSVVLLLVVIMLLGLGPLAGWGDKLTGMIPASDQELSAMRGGFLIDDGLLVSFGIERATYVNGLLDTASNLTFSRIDGVAGLQQSASALPGANSVKVIQIGPAGSNTFTSGSLAASALPGGFTVIQNSLNNQIVNNITTINASVANMNLFRSLNLTSLISQQVIHGIH